METVDEEVTAAALDFDAPMENSIDAVSDRDFALEFLSAGAILAAIPVVVLYLFLQDYIVGGLTAGSVKG